MDYQIERNMSKNTFIEIISQFKKVVLCCAIFFFYQDTFLFGQDNKILDFALSKQEETAYFGSNIPYKNIPFYISTILDSTSLDIMNSADTLYVIESIDVIALYTLNIITQPYIFEMCFIIPPPQEEIIKRCRYLFDKDFSNCYENEHKGELILLDDSITIDTYFINTHYEYYKMERTVLDWNSKVFNRMRKSKIRNRISDYYIHAIRVIKRHDGSYCYENFDYPDQSYYYIFKDYDESVEKTRRLFLQENNLIGVYKFARY